MFSQIKNKKWFEVLKKVLLSLLLGLLGGLSLVSTELSQYADIPTALNIITSQGHTVTFIQFCAGPCILITLMSLAALLVGNRTDSFLKPFRKTVEKNNIKFWIFISISSIILPICYYFLQGFVINHSFYKFNVYNLLKSVFYDSVVGELFFNFFITSLIVFLVFKVFYKKKDSINKVGLISSVCFSVLFLFSIQLNALFSLYSNVTALFLLWAILEYLLMAAIYAYAYVRYGLKISMFIHIVFTIMLLAVCPLLFNL